MPKTFQKFSRLKNLAQAENSGFEIVHKNIYTLGYWFPRNIMKMLGNITNGFCGKV